jgi:hypothetical protein
MKRHQPKLRLHRRFVKQEADPARVDHAAYLLAKWAFEKYQSQHTQADNNSTATENIEGDPEDW